MYNIWQNARSQQGDSVKLIETDIITLEEAQDIAAYLTLIKHKDHIAIRRGGKAEPVMQERARWTRINELMEDFDDAGCDWITIGDMTYIAAIYWPASSNPEVARLVRESHIYTWGSEKAKKFIYANEEDYYQRNPEIKAEMPAEA